MTVPDSVGGDERLRLFLALRLPEPALDALERWQGRHLPSRSVRVVPREQLHVTLAFLGHRPAGELPGIVGALREVAAGTPGKLRLTPVHYRETRSVAMLVLADEGGRTAALADGLQGRLEALGVYRREGREWLPHVTVARFRERPGLRPEPPNRGTYVLIPSDASAYLSRLRPGGAQYEILETVPLGGL
ncbi:MAG TPA: RNA 2',3'-cyclic phosphodiesterase [Gaiellaceae bacterium]|nr:RNA 2',3'-cyclic phosphodiesterase [Gaiellaceae bacterium]